MTVDFASAAARHLRDAGILREAGSLPNADHLAGFAAESALKSVLRRRPDGDVEDTRQRVHLPQLWDRIPVQGFARTFPPLVALLRQRTAPPFSDWSIDQRYEDGSRVTPEILERHLAAAKRLCGAVGLLGVRSEG